MSATVVIIYACLTAVEVAVIVAWVIATRRHRWPTRPSTGDVAIGGVTSFLDTLGIGNYAPSMVLLALLGMHPVAAYPIMMASDGVLIPIASLGFIKSGRFASGAVLGLTAGGVVGTFCAFPLVSALAAHVALMRWLVMIVIVYAAASMLRAARLESLRVTAAPAEGSS